MEGSKEYHLKMKEREFLELFGDELPEADMIHSVGNLLESLLNTSAISESKEREIHQALYRNEFTNEQAFECIEYLKKNQRDPIASGFNYSATDIKYKLKRNK